MPMKSAMKCVTGGVVDFEGVSDLLHGSLVHYNHGVSNRQSLLLVVGYKDRSDPTLFWRFRISTRI